jgi:hypothetical protein
MIGGSSGITQILLQEIMIDHHGIVAVARRRVSRVGRVLTRTIAFEVRVSAAYVIYHVAGCGGAPGLAAPAHSTVTARHTRPVVQVTILVMAQSIACEQFICRHHGSLIMSMISRIY